VREVSVSWSFAPLDRTDRIISTHLVPRVVFDQARVVAVGHKTDLLTLRLVRGVEPELSRNSSHLLLGHLAERKDRSRELLRVISNRK
jgi:hypothetical protein